MIVVLEEGPPGSASGGSGGGTAWWSASGRRRWTTSSPRGRHPNRASPWPSTLGACANRLSVHVLARSLTKIVAAADAPVGHLLRAPVCRGTVQQSRAELTAVAGRLAASGPVGVRGVARLRTLLADGTGPLYQPAAPEGLHHELGHVLAALDSFG